MTTLYTLTEDQLEALKDCVYEFGQQPVGPIEEGRQTTWLHANQAIEAIKGGNAQEVVVEVDEERDKPLVRRGRIERTPENAEVPESLTREDVKDIVREMLEVIGLALGTS